MRCSRNSARRPASLAACIIAFTFVSPVRAQDAARTLPATFTDPPTYWIPDEGSGWIDFTPTEGGHIIIPVTLNGDPVRAMIDTGVDQLIVSKSYADAHHLPLTPWATPTSFGGPTPYYTTPAVTLDVGALRTTRPGSVTVTDLSQMNGPLLGRFDVVIGLPLLGPLEWQVDQDHHRFRLLKSGSIPLSGGVPIRVGPRNSRLVTDAAVNGKPVSPTMIDTGSDDEVSLTPVIAKKVGFVTATNVQSVGMGGSVVQPLGRLTDFAVGSYAIDGAYATIGDKTFWSPEIPR